MASKRPRKLKSSLRTGSKAARSSRARPVVKRVTAVKKKAATKKTAAAPKTTRKNPEQGTTKRIASSKAQGPTRPTRATALPRAELLEQAAAAAIPGRHRMTLPQLRAALAQLADRPSDATTSSEAGVRWSVASTPPAPVSGLPWRYGVTELVAMPVDPLLVYVYWELSPDVVSRVHAQLGPEWSGASQVLRAYDVAGAPLHNGDAGSLVAHARRYFDLDVSADVGSYYVHLWRPEQSLIFEIGWRSHDGRFVSAARSNRVYTPRNAPAEGGTERWMTVRDGRVITTPPHAIPSEPFGVSAGHDGSDAMPWSATFPARPGGRGNRS